jgi:hypothetical protein
MRLLYVVTAAGSLLLLALDVWPGAIGFALLCPFVCCATVPLLGAAGAGWAALVAVTLTRRPEGRVGFDRRVGACIGWMVACGGLVLLEVPRVAAFWFHRDQFAALAATAPAGRGRADLGRWVGIYYVRSYAADESGGVYFVTVQHPDGIGPDAMSYGFALRPQREECPFGMSKYSASRLFGEWYSFAVSDD